MSKVKHYAAGGERHMVSSTPFASGRAVQTVVFKHWVEAMSEYVQVRVHWQKAFEYYRATRESIIGVTMTDEYGRDSERFSFGTYDMRYSPDKTEVVAIRVFVGASHVKVLEAAVMAPGESLPVTA